MLSFFIHTLPLPKLLQWCLRMLFCRQLQMLLPFPALPHPTAAVMLGSSPSPHAPSSVASGQGDTEGAMICSPVLLLYSHDLQIPMRVHRGGTSIWDLQEQRGTAPALWGTNQWLEGQSQWKEQGIAGLGRAPPSPRHQNNLWYSTFLASKLHSVCFLNLDLALWFSTWVF